MSVGKQLQRVRRLHHLTQEQFAEQLQVSRQAVSKWESGRGYPELEKIFYICNRYGITPNQLFSEEVPLPENGQLTGFSDGEEGGADRLPAKAAAGHRKLFWVIVIAALVMAGLIGIILKGGDADMYQVIWIAAMVIFGVLEAITVGLTSIWFVAGALGGLIVTMCGGPIWLQLTVFFVVSIGCLLLARPLVEKYVNKTATATNADRVLGAVARVTETINNAEPTGAVYVDGKTWTARSAAEEVIEPDTLVRVVRMEGVRLYVEEVKEENQENV